jgi:hypothetical protein
MRFTVKISNDMRWLIRLVLAGIILLSVYITLSVVKPGLFSSSRMNENMDRYGRERIDTPLYVLKAENKKLKKNLKVSKNDNDKLGEVNEKLQGDIDRLEVEVEGASKQLEDMVEKNEPSYPKEVLFIEKAIQQLNTPSIITYNYRGRSQEECSKQAQVLVDSWLQFLMLYSRLSLANVDINDFHINQLIVEHSNLLNEVSLQSLGIMAPLIRNLLAYHETVIGLNNWGEILNQSIEASSHPKAKDSLIDELYKHGYPPTNDACLYNALKINADGYSGANVSIEEWLYTFWARRHSEGTMESVFVVLKLAELVLDNKVVDAVNTYVFERHKVDKTGDIENNAKILDIYNNLFVSRSINGETALIVNDIEKKPDVNVVYPFINGNKFNAIQYLSTKSIMVGDESSLSFAHVYGSTDSSVTGKGWGEFAFYSEELVVNSTSLYAEIEASSDEVKEVEKLIESDFGSSWAIDNTSLGIKYCSKKSGKVKRFINTINEIYVASKNCSRWSGNGMLGPYVLIVATRDDYGALFIKHQFIGSAGLVGSLRFEHDYIADLDADGNVEIVISESGGLDTQKSLVELNGNGWSVIRKITGQSEDYEEYFERSSNEKLLYKESLLIE